MGPLVVRAAREVLLRLVEEIGGVLTHGEAQEPIHRPQKPGHRRPDGRQVQDREPRLVQAGDELADRHALADARLAAHERDPLQLGPQAQALEEVALAPRVEHLRGPQVLAERHPREAEVRLQPQLVVLGHGAVLAHAAPPRQRMASR